MTEMEEELRPCTVCGKPVLWGTRHPVCGRRVMAARHCGNCADGVPGGPDNCSKCGRDGLSYSHWTPAEIAAEEALAAEQAQDMLRRAEDDEHALDPDDMGD